MSLSQQVEPTSGPGTGPSSTVSGSASTSDGRTDAGYAYGTSKIVRTAVAAGLIVLALSALVLFLKVSPRWICPLPRLTLGRSLRGSGTDNDVGGRKRSRWHYSRNNGPRCLRSLRGRTNPVRRRYGVARGQPQALGEALGQARAA